MFQVGLPMLPGIELRAVSLNKRQHNEEALFQQHSRRAHVSPCFPVSHAGIIGCFPNYAGQRSVGAFHYAKVTGQRSVGIPEENGKTFSD